MLIAPSFLDLFDFLPDKIRKIIAGTCFVLGAILASIGWEMNQALSEQSHSGISHGFFELIVFMIGSFLLMIFAFLWPWNSTAKAIKKYLDAQVTDEEQDRMGELSGYPGSIGQEAIRSQNRGSDITLGEEEPQS